MTLAAKRARKKPSPPFSGKAEDYSPRVAGLLAWYDRHRRALPWRAPPDRRAEPYHVWLSEIMLQQTTVKAVGPYYAKFLGRWPDVAALAAAPLDDVLKAWAGLGYYARARNLHACARAVVEQHGGRIPRTEAALRELPGIGPYTAAAIAAIAFDERASPVDGNIERVIARLYALEAPLPSVKPDIAKLAGALTPLQRPGDFAQAMMDLGATICTPKNPACALCPWNENCAAFARGDADTFPRRAPKREGDLRRGAAFVVRRADGFVLLRTRPAKGLLGGMTEVPTTEWSKDFVMSEALKDAPRISLPRPSGERSASADAVGGSRVRGRERRNFSKSVPPHPDPLPTGERGILWRRIPGVVRHVFTHFPLELAVFMSELPPRIAAPKGTRWSKISELEGEALPSLMRKVIAHALPKEQR